MKLASGTLLGPYAIEHPIGAGGMGVVYRADDSRLGRKVAIKILPNANADQFRRFEREARAIGGLNHQNLLTLFDVGTHDGVPFLVTEMLEGESLRSRLGRGALKLREAVKIAAEVAHGLAAAHDAGVIHRDVKPDNVFLTTSGRTKILDFGIAKLRRSTVEMPAIVDPLQDTPIPTTADTGVVIGTPGYMAPEQLDAGTIDERTDIFALGVVLYEMICGKRAFISDSAVEESYAILKTTPDPPRGATKAVARVVLRCLEKRKDARFQSARDLAFALDELDASTDPVQRISRLPNDLDSPNAPTIRDPDPPMMSEPRTPLRLRWLALAGLVTVAGILGGILIGRTTHTHARWPTFVEGGPSYQRVTYHSQSRWSARLAPDGATVLYSAQHGDRDMVLRSSVAQPSISPTAIAGRLVDVSRRGEIAILSSEGPDGGTLARAFEGAGLRQVLDRVTDATFLPNDALAVIRGGLAIEYPTGTVIAKRTTGRLDLLRASPSGDRFAFVDHPASADTSGNVVVVDAAGNELIKSSSQNAIDGVAWSPDGKDVWFSNGSTIFALDRDGAEHVILRNFERLVLLDVKAGKILVAPSDQRLKMFTGPRTLAPREVGWFDSSEVEAVSTDGSTIAFVEATGTGETAEGYQHFMRHGDEPATPIGHNFHLAMLPDTTASIVIAGPSSLQRIPTGIGTPTPIPLGKLATLDISDRIAVSWSGRFVVVRGAEAGAAMHLWRIDLEHPGPEPVAPAYVDGQHPISSDGATIAIARTAGGLELVGPAGVRELPGPPGETPLSFTGNDAALFAMHLAKSTIEVERIDLATGVRAPWASITPEQKPFYYKVVLDADGNIITYSTNSDASDLYVVEPPP